MAIIIIINIDDYIIIMVITLSIIGSGSLNQASCTIIIINFVIINYNPS